MTCFAAPDLVKLLVIVALESHFKGSCINHVGYVPEQDSCMLFLVACGSSRNFWTICCSVYHIHVSWWFSCLCGLSLTE